MNFLAHCLLASPGDGWLAGGVLGDFVKGWIPEQMPAELRAGIWLHRRIDSFSNRLPLLADSVARFHPALRRPAPVLLDILADHCLALDWPRYSKEELPTFSAKVYAALASYAPWAPERARDFVDYMVRRDLLSAYAEPDVARRAMGHVLRRLRMEHLAAHLDAALDGDLAGFSADAKRYLPALAAFAQEEREKSPY